MSSHAPHAPLPADLKPLLDAALAKHGRMPLAVKLHLSLQTLDRAIKGRGLQRGTIALIEAGLRASEGK